MGLVAGATGMWLVLTRPSTHHHATEEAKEVEPKHTESHGKNEVKLSRDEQTSAGLQTASAPPGEWKPELKAYGRVLDPAPLLLTLIEIDSAQSSLGASIKEHNRIKSLYAQDQNASLQALDAAEAALKRDQLLLQAAQTRMGTGWGRALADRSDLPTLAESLGVGHHALVRIDLMPGQIWQPSATAQISSLTQDDRLVSAEYVGPAPNTDFQAQGLGFLFLIRTNPPAPGTAVVGLLPTSQVGETGWRIPESAVVRYEGATWIFAKTGEELFERRLVALDRRLADGWFVSGDAQGKDPIVILGGQMLLSEQLKGAGGEE